MQISADVSTPEIVKKFFNQPNLPSSYNETLLLEDLRRVKNYQPLKSEKKQKDNFMKYMVREWFSQRMRQKYEEISPEIFKLKRDIRIEPEYLTSHRRRLDKKQKISIPMFLNTELNKHENWTYKTNYEIEDDRYEFTIESKIPRTPLNIRNLGNEALGQAYKTYAGALTTEVLSDVISETPQYAPNPQDASLVVLWKPKPSEIHVKASVIDNDPALLLNYDKYYLVGTWDEPTEEPFMSTLELFKRNNLENLPNIWEHR